MSPVAYDSAAEAASCPGCIKRQETRMEYHLVQHCELRILECVAGITEARDATVLAFACAKGDSGLLLLHGAALPEAFFDLRTGCAGEFMQRLVNSRVRTAAVFSANGAYTDRFREFLLEARRHPQFRAFDEQAAALQWLVGGTSRADAGRSDTAPDPGSKIHRHTAAN